MGAHRLGHLRVAVTGQVGEKAAVGQLEKIDVLGAAGRFRHEGQPHMVAQRVDGAGFAGVAAADKGDFRRRVGQTVQIVGGDGKFGVVKNVHAGKVM